MSLQLNHLMDLVLFPTDAHAESAVTSTTATTIEEQGSGEDLLKRLCTVRMCTCIIR